ncbi:MCE family protein (plasmid) [Rhodococcus sp. ZPP]|uniref:MlaD family protein n=1 Tax=Rhodococcus sp. ZPP TaxID=2749906 RepID=UPI001AD88A52|nr:MlaD family protein [Rhodococcus sp. ZPP]QTJ70730.1 MCE family protein [Rhodococcus sp. ZPP]
MNPRVKFTATLFKLGGAVVVSVLLFVIVINAMTNPAKDAKTSYTAEFTDVSGLHVNGDVRAKGMQIGKVVSIDLVREGDRSIAKVGFTLQEPHQLTDTTVLAIKYQNLTGLRYVDLDETAAQSGNSVDHLGPTQTRASFDITELFNGLQPVLATMSTDEINTFTQNAITLLQGDGGGLAPMMDSVQKIADLARDRQQVISILTTNLARISDSMGGKSPQVIEFLHSAEYAIDRAMTVLDKFNETAVFGPQFMTPVHRLVTQLGLNGEFDVDQLLTHTFSSLPDAADALRLLPATIAGLQLPQQSAGQKCSSGVAKLPTDVEILLNGSEVTVCNAK